MTQTELTAVGGRTTREVAPTDQLRLRLPSGVGLGVAVLWLSLLVLLPLAAVVSKGGGSLADAFTDERSWAAIRLTVGCALGVAAINAVMGTLIAWVLVRDDFPGKRLLEIVIDLPFALPTIVAGLVLMSLYGPDSPIGVNWYASRPGLIVALLFVTLPFVVRTVEPVLLTLETDVEQAATSLGAAPLVVFRRIVLPAIAPAIASGAALAFGRAMGEYGSVVLISGQLKKTEVSSLYIYKQIQDDNVAGAAATATVLLLISVVVIAGLGVLQRWAARRG